MLFRSPIDEVGDAPDSRPFTADLPQVRAKAIELTKNSMEQGAALGAGYIVLHMGTVEPLVKRTDTAHLQKMCIRDRAHPKMSFPYRFVEDHHVDRSQV